MDNNTGYRADGMNLNDDAGTGMAAAGAPADQGLVQYVCGRK